MRAIVNSTKHYVQESLATVLAGATKAILLVNATDERTGVNNNILAGSVIKAIFVEMWVRTGDVSPGTSLISLIKTQDQQTPIFADCINLHDYQNKKNVFYHTQGLINDQDADAIPFVRQWFKIPKGKQRFGLGDRLYLTVTAQALDNIICGFATYKEYS